MSIQHIALVLEAEGLCAQEKAVLTAFCNHTDPAGKTYAGEERLMRESGMPRTTFQRWRSQLVTRRLLISRRKGRKGGGRATSDTWVNLELLRSIRDPWFDQKPSDRQEEPNPFDVEDTTEESPTNGPASGAKGGGNGSTGGAFKGPASGAGAAPSVEPVSLTNPQGEPSDSLFPTPSPDVDASPPPATDEDFEKFWAVYPKKVAKPDARKAWRAAVKRKADTAQIVCFASEQAAVWAKYQRDPQYIPYPATWLNKERYADAIEQPVTTGHRAYQNPVDNSAYHEDF